MSLTRILTASIWTEILQSMEYLQQIRDTAAPVELHFGLNFNIVLGSACLLEGALEASLHAQLQVHRSVFSAVKIPEFETRRAMNIYFSRIEKELENRIGKTIGANGYDELFALLVGQKISSFDAVRLLWERVTVLFSFRNVLAHGRQISAQQHAVNYEHGVNGEMQWLDEFGGSYKIVEDYLKKRGQQNSSFLKTRSVLHFLSNEVADHFATLPREVVKAISVSLAGLEKAAHDEALEPLLDQ